MHTQSLHVAGQQATNLTFQFRSQGFQHGRESGVDTVPSPNQFFSQWREGGAFAALHVQQWHAQLRFALSDQAPCMSV